MLTKPRELQILFAVFPSNLLQLCLYALTLLCLDRRATQVKTLCTASQVSQSHDGCFITLPSCVRRPLQVVLLRLLAAGV